MGRRKWCRLCSSRSSNGLKIPSILHCETETMPMPRSRLCLMKPRNTSGRAGASVSSALWLLPTPETYSLKLSGVTSSLGWTLCKQRSSGKAVTLSRRASSRRTPFSLSKARSSSPGRSTIPPSSNAQSINFILDWQPIERRSTVMLRVAGRFDLSLLPGLRYCIRSLTAMVGMRAADVLHFGNPSSSYGWPGFCSSAR
ncbi:hypothetical protein AGR1C_pAt30030 [Agrobacterium fabacearum TT111]|nr:hypothetical protein AGR1C_pAt30030 [Agrobacterium fabacearum TT111]